ncbi:SmORF protein [Babesia bovis T2Bo]|uniref:SmORF n=1 Tax=Babesia bovis TaxID=5865 RepID=A7ARH8_BABBO|nr:SmORF protein [Babesia bovis T2Bo]EDO07147.1 SmORF protein [Babesia bovis T2Bo]|eukprot:XP_001610715.1 SmORF [Babesia bovis T2Bo]
MVAFNFLWKFCVVLTFGLSATVTSTDVAQDQPTHKALDSGISGKEDKHDTEPVEVQEEENTKIGKHTKSVEPAIYSVEWHLLPNPESRASLREELPSDLAAKVPKDCNKSIAPPVMNRILWYFSWRDLQWFLLPKPENRAALLELLPSDVAALVSKDCNKPVTTIVENYIWKYFNLSPVDWFLLPKPESRACLREELPSELGAKIPEDCNEPITPLVENEIRKHFSSMHKRERPSLFLSHY